MLELYLLGTGGMMPLPNRFLTSMYLRYNGKAILVDCGEGTQIAMKKRGVSFKAIYVICITHFHADHVSGLPGLLLTIGNAERTEPITIVGPRGIEKIVSALRTIAPELPFPIQYRDLQENEEEFQMCGLDIKAYKVKHNVVCYGYFFGLKRAGKFDLEKAKQKNIPMQYWKRLQKGEVIKDGENTYTSDMVLGPERKGLSVAYCTDTRPVPVITEHAKNVDLFICEGMYGEEGKEEKAKEYKHMTFYEAAHIAKEAKVKKMWLTHYSPSLVRPEEYLDKAREIFPETYTCKDGEYVLLEFAEESPNA